MHGRAELPFAKRCADGSVDVADQAAAIQSPDYNAVSIRLATEFHIQLASMTTLRLTLRNPDFTTAGRIAEVINARFPGAAVAGCRHFRGPEAQAFAAGSWPLTQSPSSFW